MAKFEREVEIDSDIEKTWSYLINPSYWHEWFPGVESVESISPISVGASLPITIDKESGTATIVKMTQPKELEVLTQVGKDQDKHVFKLKSTGGLLGMKADETKVEYTLDTLSGGGMIGRFFATGNPIDSAKVNKAMIKFRKFVEKQ